jgi:hypothetical protein
MEVGINVCSFKMHIFAKIKILCNAIAGRVREPRRVVIPGLKEVLFQVAEDLHQQAEAAAEVQGKMKALEGLITKAVMPKDQTIVHSTKAVLTKDPLVDPSKRMEKVKDQPVVHLKEAVMVKGRNVFLSTGAERVKDAYANHMKEAEMAKGPPVVHLIKAVIAKDQPANHMKEAEMAKGPPVVHLIKVVME